MQLKTTFKSPFGGGNSICARKLQSDVVEWLRFPMILMVVFIHYQGDELTNQPMYGANIYDSIRILLCHVVSRAAVPSFFVISGYYFFYNSKLTLVVYRQKLKQRFKTLFVPYMLWNLIVLLSAIITKVGAFFLKGKPLYSIIEYLDEKGWIDIFWSCNEWEGMTSWLGKQMINTAPLLVPMWFIRDLMVVVVLTPVIYYACKKMGTSFLLLLFVAYISSIYPKVPGFSIGAIFYFSIGAFLAIRGRNIITVFRAVRIPAFVLITLLIPIMVYFDGQYTPTGNLIYPFFVLTLVAVYFNVATMMVERNCLTWFFPLSKASFFIFALHTIYVLAFSDKIMKFIIPSDFWLLAILRYIFTPLLCVAICYGLFLLMQRFTPRFLGVLTGNRVGQ